MHPRIVWKECVRSECVRSECVRSECVNSVNFYMQEYYFKAIERVEDDLCGEWGFGGRDVGLG